MKGNVVQLVQGTPEWNAHRLAYRNASEAKHVLGYGNRLKLLRAVKFAIEDEISEFTEEVIFANGHTFEALTRPLAEQVIGQSLFPVTVCHDDVMGVKMGASLDGITGDDLITWEHKSLNKDLAQSLDDGIIPEEYWPQMEQGLLLTGAEKCLFSASKWVKNDNDEWVLDEHKYAWYHKNIENRKKLVAAWQQFDKDLETFEDKGPELKLVGNSPGQLPMLNVQVSGQVIATNFDVFRDQAIAVISSINEDLQTDQHFADAENAVKFCAEVETRIKTAKALAQSQAESIDNLFRALDEISELARQKRLNLGKLVTSKKDEIKRKLINEYIAQWHQYVAELNGRVCGQYMPETTPDFAGVIKGLKTIDSMRDRCMSLLAEQKIIASKIADVILENRRYIEENGNSFLVPDFKTICTKSPDDFRGLVALRSKEHEEHEQKERQRLQEQKANATQSVAATAATTEPTETLDTVIDTDLIEVEPSSDINQHWIGLDELKDEAKAWLEAIDIAPRTKVTVEKYLIEFIDFRFSGK